MPKRKPRVLRFYSVMFPNGVFEIIQSEYSPKKIIQHMADEALFPVFLMEVPSPLSGDA